ncbi:MAG TPA: hypothetical protein VN824_09855, partial [Puia sp.]|nr:hypothetical protein [Puia sp.]
YYELRNQVAAYYLNASVLPEGVKSIMAMPEYVGMTKGDYPLTLKYVLPGTRQVTSSVPLSIKF